MMFEKTILSEHCKILTLTEPPIEEYPLITLFLSILSTYNNELMPWLCNNFIHVKAATLPYYLPFRFQKDVFDNMLNSVQDEEGKVIIRNYYNLDDDDQVYYRIPHIRRYNDVLRIIELFTLYCKDYTWIAMPILFENPEFNNAYPLGMFENKVNVELIRERRESFTRFLIDYISCGFYVYLFIDQYYIPGIENYQRRHFSHPTTVYGYNQKTRKFYLADFYDVHFNGITVDFEVVEEAINKTICNTERPFEAGVFISEEIRCFKYVNHKQIIDMELIKRSLEDYLNATDTISGYKSLTIDNNLGYLQGVELYQVIAEYIHLILDIGMNILRTDSFRGHFEYKYFQIFYAHKVAMLMRIKYLGEKGFLRQWETIYDDYKTIERKFKLYRNCATKSFMTCKSRALIDILNELPVLRDKETDILEKMLVNMVV